MGAVFTKRFSNATYDDPSGRNTGWLLRSSTQIFEVHLCGQNGGLASYRAICSRVILESFTASYLTILNDEKLSECIKAVLFIWFLRRWRRGRWKACFLVELEFLQKIVQELGVGWRYCCGNRRSFTVWRDRHSCLFVFCSRIFANYWKWKVDNRRGTEFATFGMWKNVICCKCLEIAACLGLGVSIFVLIWWSSIISRLSYYSCIQWAAFGSSFQKRRCSKL